MDIISSNINSNSISLVSDTPFTKLVLSYDRLLKSSYIKENINTEQITINKEELGLDTLDNIYFKVEIFNTIDKADAALYNIEVINNLETKYYNANTLKQELDNLNYYSGIIESLNRKSEYLAASDFFFNYIEFLEKKLNGNNFIQTIRR